MTAAARRFRRHPGTAASRRRRRLLWLVGLYSIAGIVAVAVDPLGGGFVRELATLVLIFSFAYGAVEVATSLLAMRRRRTSCLRRYERARRRRPVLLLLGGALSGALAYPTWLAVIEDPDGGGVVVAIAVPILARWACSSPAPSSSASASGSSRSGCASPRQANLAAARS